MNAALTVLMGNCAAAAAKKNKTQTRKIVSTKDNKAINLLSVNVIHLKHCSYSNCQCFTKRCSVGREGLERDDWTRQQKMSVQNRIYYKV